MNNDYLNPVELLELTERDAVTPADLRKAKKRFLTEMQLDEREDFDYYGRLYTQNDLNRATEEAEDDAWLTAYLAAAKSPGLSEFLVTAKSTAELDTQQLHNPRLGPLLRRYFEPVYAQALGRAVASGDSIDVEQLLAWNPTLAGLREGQLYQEAYRALEARTHKIEEALAAFVRDPNSEQAQPLRRLQVFHDQLPKDVIQSLPAYFGDLFDRFISRLLPHLVTVNNRMNRPKMALEIARYLYSLPQLSDARRNELKQIGQRLKENVKAINQQRTSSSNDGVGVGRVIWYVILGIFFLVRLGTCIGRNSSSQYGSTYYDRPGHDRSTYYVPPPPPPPPPERSEFQYYSEMNFDRDFVLKLRLAVALEEDLGQVKPSDKSLIDDNALDPLRRPGAGVMEANQTLTAIGEDTIFHLAGVVMKRPGLAFDIDATYHKQKGATSDKRQDPFYQALVDWHDRLDRDWGYEPTKAEIAWRNTRLANQTALKKAYVARYDAIDAENRRVTASPPPPPPPPPPAKPAPPKERPTTSFARADREPLVSASLGSNYVLYPKRGKPDDGRLLRMRVATDDQTVGALFVWRDTLGVRQLRYSNSSNAHYTFHVATGQVDQLLKSYVVYGRKWDPELKNPWGLKGWYKEVLGYHGPATHGGFVNGKRKNRKNFWLPATKATKKKGMTPQQWLAGIKKL